MREDRRQEQPKDPIFYIGATLVGVGGVSLIYLVLSVVQILKSPEESGLVQWIMNIAQSNEMILRGYFGEENFEIEASEAFQYLILCVLGLIVVRLLTSIFMTLITEGANLLMTDKTRRKVSRPTNRNQPVAVGDSTR